MPITICLAGNPNSGKTTVFNSLCGARERVGNWSGTTVERKEGSFRTNGQEITVVDLPGIYSLNAYSIDEKIARDFLLKEKPSLVVTVIDASNIERNLFLVCQLIELGQRVILDLNMTDVAQSLGMKIDAEKLANILGITVVQTVASKGKGLPELRAHILNGLSQDQLSFTFHYGDDVENVVKEIITILETRKFESAFSLRGIALRYLQDDDEITALITDLPCFGEVEKIKNDLSGKISSTSGKSIEDFITSARVAYLKGLTKEVVESREYQGSETVSDRIDRILTHRFLGIPIFLFFMFLLFQFVFAIGGPITELVEDFFTRFAEVIGSFFEKTRLPSWVGSLISDGIISGVGSVIVFLPNILLLYLGISVLEDSGYLARGAYVMDRFMHALGLHGKSFIPMLLGFGCNVAGIMAARTLESHKDRIITVLVNPFMSCAARLPVYVLFASVFFPKYQGLIVFSLYFLGIVLAIIVAKVLKSVFFREETAPLVMEMPPYHFPNIKNMLILMWVRASLFLKKAGTVIICAVIIIWLLSSLPWGVEYASGDSFLGMLGKAIAPVLKPAGYGFWQAAVALLSGIMAKEIVIGTFGTLLGSGEAGLSQALPQYFTPLSAYAFMIMIVVYIPCVATIAVIKRETSWGWMTLSLGYSIILGWILSVLFYQIGSLFI